MVVEDSSGSAERIALYNFIDKVGKVQLSDIIPIGTRMIVKEPFYKMASDGYPIIGVEKPTDLIFLGHDDQMLCNVSFSTKFEEKRDSEWLKSKGNELFGEKLFNSAVIWYSKAICAKKLPIYYCNRSIAFYNFGNFEKSLLDALESIQLETIG